ncbi:hypothetical protein JCM33374_g3614 [Metschnikowia sp. JCM 33374]|nr:hypothetical protein JCM33374_g3614 [Metschnikowia sp. JCM 33374]
MQCLDTIGTLDKINQNRSGLDRILNLDKNIFQELNFMEPARNISPSSQMVMEDIDVSFMAKNNLEKFSSSFQRRNSQNWVFIQNNLGPKIPSGKLSSRISSVKMERRVSLRRMSLRRNSSKLPSKSHSADHITSVNSSSLTSKNVLKSKSTPVYYKKTSVLESLRNYIPTSEICATKVDFYNRGGELRLKKSYYKKYPAQRPRGYKSLVPKKRRISWSSLECSTNDPIQLPVKQFENITGRASNENRIRTFERRLKKIKLDILKIDEGVYKKISSPGFFSDKSTVEADKRYLEINPFGSRPKGRDAFSHHDIADKSLRKEIPTEGKFSKLSSKESSSFSLIGPSFNYNQARELEEGKHVRRLSVLLSHFPISSSELCSATSVLELPITQKLMPLNVDCLDDPVTALRIGNFPSIHHGHDENKDTSSKDPHLGIGYPIAVVQNINWISLSTKESDSQESPTVNFKDSFSKTKTSIDTSLDRGLQHFISSGSDNSLSRRRVPNTNGLLIKAGQEMQAYFSGNIGTGNTLSNSEDDVFHDVMSPDNDSEETKNGSPAQDHLYSATRFKDKSMLPVWQEKFSASSNLETVGSSPETFTDAINTAGEFSLENHDSIDLGKADVFSSSYPKSILLDSKKHESETAYPKKVRFSLTRTLFEKDHVKCHQLPSINMKTLERRLSSKTGGIDHTRSNFRKGTLGNYSPPRDSMNSSVEQTAILDTFSRDIYSAVVTDKDIDDDFEKEAESSTVAIVRILTLSKSGELRPHFFQYVNGSLRNLGSGSSTKCERL